MGALTYQNTITDRLLTGRLELGDLDGLWLGETVVGAGHLTAIDRNWPDQAFIAPLPQGDGLPLKIDLSVKARSLELVAPYIFQQPKFDVIWREDSLVLSGFTGLLEGGQVAGGLQLENVGGEAVLKSHIRVEDAALAPFIWQRDGRSIANGLLDVNFNVETQGRSMAGLVSGLSGNGTFTLRDAVLNYINPEAFELVVRAVDAGLELKEEDIEKAFVSHMDAGSTRVTRLEGAFRVAGGALRANNIEAEAEILQSRGNLMLDLSAQTINGDWSIKVEPNEEDAVTGAQPEVGLVFSGDIGAPIRMVDVAPFTGYLSIRAFEREVDRVERLQADILEKERMRRLLKVYRQNEKRREAERIAAEEAAELEKLRAEEEAKRQAQEAKLKATEEAKRQQEEAKREAAKEKARNRAEAARKAEEARKAAQERTRQVPSPTEPAPGTGDAVNPNAIEIRPLDDLVPNNDQGAAGESLSEQNFANAFNQQPRFIAPRVLPDALITLPRSRGSATLPADQASGEVTLPQSDGFNELIEQLRGSPDRIIQLD